ncbi:MAG: hypothetical protein AB8B80_05650 [Marinicellaceae bacterium]
MIKQLLIFKLIIFCSVGFCQNSVFTKGEVWTISEGNIQSNGSDKDVLSDKYWQYLNKILPTKLLHQHIVSLRLFSDGIANDLGGISPLNKENSQWEIDIDTYDFNFKNTHPSHVLLYSHTIIHEFGHLLTLNPEQLKVSNDVNHSVAEGYLAKESHLKTDSYLGIFIHKFWQGTLFSEWDSIQNYNNPSKREHLLYQLYLNNKNQFLTDYAVESPEEDIAESWAFFVLSEKPVMDKIKHQKVLFFYEFPELVEYRKNIRNNLELIPQDYIKNYEFNRDQLSSN